MTLRTGSNGFTLIEVMVTVAVLSLGTLIIHQGFLRSADVLVHYNSQLAAEEWADNKLWAVKESLFFTDENSAEGSNGTFEEAGRIFNWSLESNPVPGTDELYLIRMNLSWNEGNKPVSLVKTAYATFNKPSPAA